MNYFKTRSNSCKCEFCNSKVERHSPPRIVQQKLRTKCNLPLLDYSSRSGNILHRFPFVHLWTLSTIKSGGYRYTRIKFFEFLSMTNQS